MTLSTSDWIVIIGIILASILGVLSLLKKNKSKNYKIDANQSSGMLSKGSQKQSITIKDSSDE